MLRLFSLILIPLLARSSSGYDLPLDCAPNGGIMTTPTYGTTGALFTVCAETAIASSPCPIYNVLLDFHRYHIWNTFVYAVDLPGNVSNAKDVYVGMPMTLHTSGLISGANTTSDEKVGYLEPNAEPAFMGWGVDPESLDGLLLRAEHISLLHDLGNGTTKYVSWETYYGAGAATILPLKQNLQTEFANQGRDLKKRMEQIKT